MDCIGAFAANHALCAAPALPVAALLPPPPPPVGTGGGPVSNAGLSVGLPVALALGGAAALAAATGFVVAARRGREREHEAAAALAAAASSESTHKAAKSDGGEPGGDAPRRPSGGDPGPGGAPGPSRAERLRAGLAPLGVPPGGGLAVGLPGSPAGSGRSGGPLLSPVRSELAARARRLLRTVTTLNPFSASARGARLRPSRGAGSAGALSSAGGSPPLSPPRRTTSSSEGWRGPGGGDSEAEPPGPARAAPFLLQDPPAHAQLIFSSPDPAKGHNRRTPTGAGAVAAAQAGGAGAAGGGDGSPLGTLRALSELLGAAGGATGNGVGSGSPLAHGRVTGSTGGEGGPLRPSPLRTGSLDPALAAAVAAAAAGAGGAAPDAATNELWSAAGQRAAAILAAAAVLAAGGGSPAHGGPRSGGGVEHMSRESPSADAGLAGLPCGPTGLPYGATPVRPRRGAQLAGSGALPASGGTPRSVARSSGGSHTSGRTPLGAAPASLRDERRSPGMWDAAALSSPSHTHSHSTGRVGSALLSANTSLTRDGGAAAVAVLPLPPAGAVSSPGTATGPSSAAAGPGSRHGPQSASSPAARPSAPGGDLPQHAPAPSRRQLNAAAAAARGAALEAGSGSGAPAPGRTGGALLGSWAGELLPLTSFLGPVLGPSAVSEGSKLDCSRAVGWSAAAGPLPAVRPAAVQSHALRVDAPCRPLLLLHTRPGPRWALRDAPPLRWAPAAWRQSTRPRAETPSRRLARAAGAPGAGGMD